MKEETEKEFLQNSQEMKEHYLEIEKELGQLRKRVPELEKELEEFKDGTEERRKDEVIFRLIYARNLVKDLAERMAVAMYCLTDSEEDGSFDEAIRVILGSKMVLEKAYKRRFQQDKEYHSFIKETRDRLYTKFSTVYGKREVVDFPENPTPSRCGCNHD